MKTRPGDYLYRTEDHRHRDGTKGVIAYRRRVLTVERDRIELDGVQRAEITDGQPVTWQPVGGLLGRGAWLTWERVRSSGYTSRQPKGI